MAIADGKIEIAADFDISKIKGELQELSKGLEDLKSSVTTAFDVNSIESFGQSCGNLISEFSGIKDIVETTFGISTGAIEKFAETISADLNLSELFSSLEPGFETISSGVGNIQSGIDTFKTSFDNFKSSIGAAIPSVDSISGCFDKVKSSVEDVKTGFGEIKTGIGTFKDGIGSVESGFDNIKTGVDAIKDGFSSGLGSGFEAIVTNVDTIKSGFDSFKEGFDAFKAGVDTITSGLDTVKSGFETGSEIVGIIKDVNSAIGDGTVVKIAETVAQDAMSVATTIWGGVCTVATGVTTAFGAAMQFLLGPVGLIILAIVALIAIVVLLIQNWDWVKEKAIEIWTAISEFFTQLWATITEAVAVAWQAIVDFIVGLWTGISGTAIAVWTAIADFFTQLWATITAAVTIAWQAIVDFVVGLWTGISETAIGVWTAIADFFTGIMDGIKLGFTNAWDGIKEVWGVVAQWFTDNIINPVQKAFDGFKGAVIGAWDAIWLGIKSVINKILGGIESFINGIIGGVNNLIAGLNSIIGLGSKVTEAMGFGSIGPISSLGGISLPRLAQGAVIPPNREFAAILGDQKSGVNIETPLDTMILAFKTALAEGSGGNGDRPIYLTVESTLDGKTVARNQVKYLPKEYSRVGTSAVKVGA